MANNLNDLNQYEELREYAAAHGKKLNNTHHVRLANARDRAREEFRQREKANLSWHERLNRRLPSMQNAIINVALFIFISLKMIATTVLIPVILLLVAVVETVRVAHGLELFEASTWLANFGAIALVLSNVVLEFNIEDIEHRHGYQSDLSSKFSLRILAENMLYILGIGDKWQRALKSPAARFHKQARGLKLAILVLAVAGSMKPMFESLSGNWQQGLSQIYTDSSLLQLVTWVGGFVFAWTVVSLTSTFTAYVAELATDAQNALPEYDTDDEESYINRQAALELKTILSEMQEKEKEKSVKVIPVSQMNGHHVEAFHQASSSTNGNGASSNGHV